MTSSELNVEWRKSAKGNHWAKLGDHLVVVGQSPFGFWVSIDSEFIKGASPSNLEEAQRFAERHIQQLGER